MNTPMDTPAQDHIWTRAYTPAGFQVSITVHFANGQPMSATELDSLLTSNGYLPSLPGTEPGEEVETMTHVVRRVHTNKDGSTTPIIAFYHENTKLEFKFDHKYLNTADEIAEFEALAGIRLADIPLCEWPSYPKRSDANAQRYVVKLPNPVKVIAVDSTYTKDDGSTGTTKKIKSFVGVTPRNVTDMPSNEPPGIEFFDDEPPVTKEGYTEATDIVVTKQDTNGREYYTIEGVQTWKRDLFRTIELDDVMIDSLKSVGVHTLPTQIQIVYTVDGKGKKQPARVKRMDTGKVYQVSA